MTSLSRDYITVVNKVITFHNSQGVGPTLTTLMSTYLLVHITFSRVITAPSLINHSNISHIFVLGVQLSKARLFTGD